MACLNYSSSNCAFTYFSFTINQAEGRHRCQYISFILLFQMKVLVFPLSKQSKCILLIFSEVCSHPTSCFSVFLPFTVPPHILYFRVAGVSGFQWKWILHSSVSLSLLWDNFLEQKEQQKMLYLLFHFNSGNFSITHFKSHCFMYILYYLNQIVGPFWYSFTFLIAFTVDS